MVSHNEVVAVVLPHQIRDGLYLHIHIAGKQKNKKRVMSTLEQHSRCISLKQGLIQDCKCLALT